MLVNSDLKYDNARQVRDNYIVARHSPKGNTETEWLLQKLNRKEKCFAAVENVTRAVNI